MFLYLRDDQTVDIDSALNESRAMAPFSRDLWERLKGHGEESESWDQHPADVPVVPRRVVDRQATLIQAKNELARAQQSRAKVLKDMRAFKPVSGVANDDEKKKQVQLTSDLFRWDRVITGRMVMVLLANVELLFEQVASELEKKLEQISVPEWDTQGKDLKTFVFEFSLLDKQVAPYIQFVQEDPEAVRARGLDSDELRMLESHIARIAGRLGICVDRVGESTGSLRFFRHQWTNLRGILQKVSRGVMFYANGMRLLGQDLQHAAKLVLKVLFLKHTLEPREVQFIYRAVKDFLVLIPFLIILLIPLSPPGHVLVFSLILKVWPDFFPSPFTERRQNVMKIYDEIKPASVKKDWN